MAADPVLNLERVAALQELGDENTNLFGSLVEMFIEEYENSYSAMMVAHEGGDARALANVAHRLKGSSGNIGAERMASLCADIERTADAGDASGCGSKLECIETHFPDLLAALSVYRDG